MKMKHIYVGDQEYQCKRSKYREYEVYNSQIFMGYFSKKEIKKAEKTGKFTYVILNPFNSPCHLIIP
jgi:hypothetical protein